MVSKTRLVHFHFWLVAFILAFGFSPFAVSAATPEDALAQAAQLELSGKFNAASNTLNQALAENLSAARRKKIEFELDRLHRIELDFPFTQDALFAALKNSVRGLTTNEFEQWVKEGRFDSREIDGTRWFMGSSVANLYFRYPELDSRRLDGKDNTAYQKAILKSCRDIKQAVLREGTPYVLPKRFDVTMTVTAAAGVAPAGQIIRAWLPIPRAYPYQTNFEIVTSSPPAKEIAPETSPIRSAYFEQAAKADEPTEFKINYRYTHYGVWFDIDPKKVTPFDGQDPAIAKFTREAPNIVFTPEMRALSQKIVGDEKNPALIAETIYDWIGANIHYSFAIEYSTIRNISDYCRSRGYGDCGQEAMLFITLCRLNGIPARWQTGWDIFPGGKDIHDWSEIYLAPYGWIPVDPYMCVFATRYATALTFAERREVRDFYFGGLNQWRMAANGDSSQTLSPPKNSFRSDNVDFQRGELEWDDHNIYFNHYHYDLEVTELPATNAVAK